MFELLQVKVVHTKSALHFMKMAANYAPEVHARFAAAASASASAPTDVAAESTTLTTPQSISVLNDEAEWLSYRRVHEDAVLHIEVSCVSVAPSRTNR